MDGTTNSAVGGICGTMISQFIDGNLVGSLIVYYQAPNVPDDVLKMYIATCDGIFEGPFFRKFEPEVSESSHRLYQNDSDRFITISQRTSGKNSRQTDKVIEIGRKHGVGIRFAGTGAACGEIDRLLQGRTHAIIYMGTEWWDAAPPTAFIQRSKNFVACMLDGSPIPDGYWSGKPRKHKLILACSQELVDLLSPILLEFVESQG